MWQTIDSAPNGDWSATIDMWANGERVTNCSWSRPENWRVGKEHCWCYQEYEQGFGYANYEVRNPTHWMPLPTSPDQP